MNEEIYETTLGLFRMIAEHEGEDLVQVQVLIPGNVQQIWEQMGFMKRKEFFNMIKSYNPKKKIL